MPVHVGECLFLKSQTHVYRRSIGISEVIDILGYYMLGMWVIAEQPDKNIIRLANLFSSEMF
jgi:hypothetical protein